VDTSTPIVKKLYNIKFEHTLKNTN